jgi:hypothetical protein
MTATVQEKSKQRARTMIRRKCLSMQADRLLTLTFRENIQDIDVAWKCFKEFARLMRKRWRNFQYVCVPEYQKRGAVHFHVAIRGYYHANTVRAIWNRALAGYSGNIDITSPRFTNKDLRNSKSVSRYISKYISKDDSVEFNRRRYSSGGKIEVPEPVTGWLPYCDFVVSALCTTLENMTHSPVQHIWESDKGVPIIYIST